MKYPIYRKFKNGREFHKVISETHYISVWIQPKHGQNIYRIVMGFNAWTLGEILGDDLSQASNRDEFEKAYGEAQHQFQKAMTIV